MKGSRFALLAVVAAALLSGCIVVTDGETPQDRVIDMALYSVQKTESEVLNPLSILSLSLRIDSYLASDQSSRDVAGWSDLYGNVFRNEVGDVILWDRFEFYTGGRPLGTLSTKWKVAAGRVYVFECIGADTWTCTSDGMGKDCSVTFSLTSREKGTWNIEYSSAETYEDRKAIFSVTDLVGTCDGVLHVEPGTTHTYVDLPSALLKGIVRTDFYTGASLSDWIEVKWEGNRQAYKSSRD